jgi:hypothetical protein
VNWMTRLDRGGVSRYREDDVHPRVVLCSNDQATVYMRFGVPENGILRFQREAIGMVSVQGPFPGLFDTTYGEDVGCIYFLTRSSGNKRLNRSLIEGDNICTGADSAVVDRGLRCHREAPVDVGKNAEACNLLIKPRIGYCDRVVVWSICELN